MARRLLAVGLMLATGFTFGVFTLGGCAGAAWPSNGKLPERVVDRLKECGEKGPIPLASVSYDLTFTVHVTEDENEARVDDVMLIDSTLHFHEVEACMRDALYGMRTPLEALALRRRNLSPGKAAEPEARSLFGQAQVALFMEVAAVIVVGYAAYTVVVHLLVDKHRTKPRSHPAKPETAEPPMPAPALQVATAEPTATAAPTATSVPTATAVPTVMPLTSAEDKEEYEKRCARLRDECLGSGYQPVWNRKRFGIKKDCGACFRECKNHSKGEWPDKKCPRN